jgi:hypothetical protein
MIGRMSVVDLGRAPLGLVRAVSGVGSQEADRRHWKVANHAPDRTELPRLTQDDHAPQWRLSICPKGKAIRRNLLFRSTAVGVDLPCALSATGGHYR